MWTQRRSGQIHPRDPHDHRDPYERDRTRVIHCPAFRRLQGKTQILGTDEGDFHRTRLTHSLEVASIGCSIVRHCMRNTDIEACLPTEDLMTVICLLHDIGHPPFGHGGEVALNYMMHQHGGFEGNAQTLRVVTQLENSYGEHGLDLTRRALLGLLKYPVPWSRAARTHWPESSSLRMNDWTPPKAYFDSEADVVSWLLLPFEPMEREAFQQFLVAPNAHSHGRAAYHDIDCSIMDLADDIAYGVHDLEDAIHLRLILRHHLDTPRFQDLLQASALAQYGIVDKLFDPTLAVRKKAIGHLVNYFITHLEIKLTEGPFQHALLTHTAQLTPDARALLDYLMQSIHQHVIDSQEARTFEYGGQKVVQRLFEAFSSNPHRLLDAKRRVLFFDAGSESEALRVVCDYIASMTDDYAYRMHERLFGLNTRTIFERL